MKNKNKSTWDKENIMAMLFVFAVVLFGVSIYLMFSDGDIERKAQILKDKPKLLDEARYDFLMSANRKQELWTTEQKLKIERLWFEYRAYEQNMLKINTQAP